MISHQFTSQPPKLTVWNKVSLALWIIACLTLLSFFTFTLFIIALVVGVVIFVLNFFRRGPRTHFPRENETTTFRQTRTYRSDQRRDDDIIDV
ncbi:MAG: hypothetical protein QGH62_00475 [Nitrospinaceae bacterium]|jgi:hypothetical protein|nr:hypothetical protein [Nitrospinaceae bacterium]MDP7610895.1 hypothetical protein [Nitrospinaceae bacterium]|tara:strand:- start:914 stop:1192 length:279 start_codon:yes stop_codon:yes gene_type:complete